MRIGQAIRRAAQLHGGRPALHDPERTVPWAELEHRVRRAAGGLRDLGIRPGDRVAILAGNSTRYLEALYAIAWTGAVSVPINTRLAEAEMADWITDSGSTALLTDQQFADTAIRLRTGQGSVPTVIGMDDPGPQQVSLEDLLTGGTPAAEADGDGAALAGIFYTGGTTGRSKGVMLSHDNLLASAMHLLPSMGWDDSSHFLHAAPMFHLADGVSSFAALLVAGCQSAIPRFTAAGLLDAVEQTRVTTTVIVPTMINLITLEPSAADRDLSSWQSLVYGGSPIPEAVMQRAAATLPGVRLFQLYGQTEASPALTLLGPEHHVIGPANTRSRAAGRALVGCEIRIVDEQDQPLPAGQVGEICGRGDNVMVGYWNQPAETARTLRGGWLHTGDAGYLDDDGFLFVVDRVKDMIVTGAENVYSAEVENALCLHPAVAEAVVIGIPATQWGEQVHAIVRLHPGQTVTEADLVAYCRTRIAGYKCPRSIEFRTEPFPVSGAGKYLKKELREHYWRGLARQVN
jgi:long-chain acyl-CoA synthetase